MPGSCRARCATGEVFLNRHTPREKLTARYLYEHLFRRISISRPRRPRRRRGREIEMRQKQVFIEIVRREFSRGVLPFRNTSQSRTSLCSSGGTARRLARLAVEGPGAPRASHSSSASISVRDRGGSP